MTAFSTCEYTNTHTPSNSNRPKSSWHPPPCGKLPLFAVSDWWTKTLPFHVAGYVRRQLRGKLYMRLQPNGALLTMLSCWIAIVAAHVVLLDHSVIDRTPFAGSCHLRSYQASCRHAALDGGHGWVNLHGKLPQRGRFDAWAEFRVLPERSTYNSAAEAYTMFGAEDAS